MRILFLHQTFSSTNDVGSGRANDFAKCLADDEHEVVILAGTFNYLTGAVLPKYEGRGIGFEASKEIMKLAHYKFGLKKVTAITSPINLNSIKLLKKLGLSYQKTVIPFEDGEELLLFVKSFA